jgi:hypothetical protein
MQSPSIVRICYDGLHTYLVGDTNRRRILFGKPHRRLLLLRPRRIGTGPYRGGQLKNYNEQECRNSVYLLFLAFHRYLFALFR